MVNYFLARFPGPPWNDGEKERSIYKKGETNEKENGRFSKSKSLKQVPNLKIKT